MFRAPPPEAGLCATCVHCRTVRNARGSVFYRCSRAETDPGYVRYPRLPVRACPGYESGPEQTTASPRR